ncbi:hypothetical protein PALA111701_12800 [Paenibacillus lactis]
MLLFLLQDHSKVSFYRSRFASSKPYLSLQHQRLPDKFYYYFFLFALKSRALCSTSLNKPLVNYTQYMLAFSELSMNNFYLVNYIEVSRSLTYY